MKTALRSLSFLLLFIVQAGPLAASPPDALTAGKFLVLRNGRTLEGDIQLVDDQYRVRRNGGETLVPAKQVLRLFADTEAAYQFLRTKANLNDPDERLRLARWCLEFNLRSQAEEEASVALVLRPHDQETKQLLQRIQQPPETVAPKPAPLRAVVPEPQASTVELTPEALGQFTHKVQPILLNACASCHAAGSGGSFTLMRIGDVPALNRQATQHNLTAVLGQLNYVQMAASPLLTKAISIHGGIEQAPLKGRQSVPYQTLEEWLRITLATNPQLQQRAGIAAVPPPPLPETKTVFAETKPESPQPNLVPPPPGVDALPRPLIPFTDSKLIGADTKPVAPPSAPVVKAPQDSGDPFDPAEFNRQAHPEREPAPKP